MSEPDAAPESADEPGDVLQELLRIRNPDHELVGLSEPPGEPSTPFEAVEIRGHCHWNGLFSQNPPVNDLLTVAPDRKPKKASIVTRNGDHPGPSDARRLTTPKAGVDRFGNGYAAGTTA